MPKAGYVGRMLRADLSTGEFRRDTIGEDVLRAFIGGTGLGIKVLYDEMPPGARWDSEDNLLMLAGGPLSGTRVNGSGTLSVITKSPLNDSAAAAQMSGYFAARQRFAGYEFILMRGIAPQWSYLYIEDGRPELRDARHLLGKDTWETEDALLEELGKSNLSVLCIGPAGESGALFAGIFHDHGHVAASGGCGAVLGAKRIKAVAVRGNRRPPVCDTKRLDEADKALLKLANTMGMGLAARKFGTFGNTRFFPNGGIKFDDSPGLRNPPVKNLTTTLCPEMEGFSGVEAREKYSVKRKPCWACDYEHNHYMRLSQDKYPGLILEEPEHEEFVGFTSLIGNFDPEAGLYLGDICDRLGFDAKEASFTISLAIECFEKGLLTSKDTGGLALRWGNVPAVAALLGQIAVRQGFGNTLADGVMRAAQAIGGDAPNYAVYVHQGNGPHVHEPRAKWSLLFGQIISDMNSIAGHAPDWKAPPTVPELQHLATATIPDFSVEFLPGGTAKSMHKPMIIDSLVICSFHVGPRVHELCDLLNAVTGWDVTPDEMTAIGLRIVNLLRCFNLRHGLEPRRHDMASPRLLEPIPDGINQGVAMGPSLQQMKEMYYREMGWDENGRPLAQTLRQLGLAYAAEQLHPMPSGR